MRALSLSSAKKHDSYVSYHLFLLLLLSLCTVRAQRALRQQFLPAKGTNHLMAGSSAAAAGGGDATSDGIGSSAATIGGGRSPLTQHVENGSSIDISATDNNAILNAPVTSSAVNALLPTGTGFVSPGVLPSIVPDATTWQQFQRFQEYQQRMRTSANGPNTLPVAASSSGGVSSPSGTSSVSSLPQAFTGAAAPASQQPVQESSGPIWEAIQAKFQPQQQDCCSASASSCCSAPAPTTAPQGRRHSYIYRYKYGRSYLHSCLE